MNPIFSKNPTKAVAIARALGAVQGPENAPEERLRAFLALIRPRRPTSASVSWGRREKFGHALRRRTITAVLRYRVGPILLTVDVLHVNAHGGAVADAESPADLIQTWFAEFHLGAHYHPARTRSLCPRCELFHPAMGAVGLPQRGIYHGVPYHDGDHPYHLHPMAPKAYGLALGARVRDAIAQSAPEFVEEVLRLAREAAWRAIEEGER